MTVKELVNIFKKVRDPDIAEIVFWHKKGKEEEQPLRIRSIGQMGILTDVNIVLEDCDSNMPIIVPATFQRRHKKMVNNVVKKINKESAYTDGT